MFRYDKTTNTLICQKIEEPAHVVDTLADQKTSYLKFRTETVYECMQYLCDQLKEKFNAPSLKLSIKLGKLYTSTYKREIKKQYDRYWPVKAKFNLNGFDKEEFEILKIPYMDDDCVLNINGERRILLMQLVAAEDISYDMSKDTLSIAMPARNISVIAKPKNVVLKYGSNRVGLEWVIAAMLIKENIRINFTDYFSNAHVVSAFGELEGMVDATILSMIDNLNILNTYAGSAYALGNTREALNAVLSLDRCLNRELSRPVLNYQPGTIITEEILKDLKRHLVNEVYVRDIPNLSGYKLAQNFKFDVIPKGTKNCTIIREVFPEYASFAYIPEDIEASITLYPGTENTPYLRRRFPEYADLDIITEYREVHGLILEAGTALTQDEIEFLYNLGVETVYASKTATGTPRMYRFEQEIIGNYTCKLSDVLGYDIPAGRSADEYVYYYNNDTLAPCSPEHLTVHDLMAIYSLTSMIYCKPETNDLHNKDTGFLKKVLLADDVFKINLIAAVDEFIAKYKNSLSKAFASTDLAADKFFGLTSTWTRKMWTDKFTMLAVTVNPIATLTQTNNIVTKLSGEPPEEVRLLAMGYYGRICPYETPAGQKLGITNTKAIGAKIENNLLLTPYRKVLKDAAGIKISDKLTWLNAKEESKFRIGDTLSLMKDSKGNFVNNRIMARVPAPGNQVTVETIDAYSLDYVNAYPEQHMSPTAMLIPFAACNDAIRVTYATNMLKQSILVQNSEVPRVYTSMYRDCFTGSNTFVIRAKKDGMVGDIFGGNLVLDYYDGTEDIIEVAETSVTSQSINFINFKVQVGDTFKAGDILVDSAIAKDGIYSPGINTLVAYIPSGWNYEDAVQICESAAAKFTSISAEEVKTKVRRSSGLSVAAGRENYYNYIPENGIITHLTAQNKSDYRRETSVPIVAHKASGILYNIDNTVDQKRNREVKCQLLSFNKLHVGDKMAGRHSNKGTDSIVTPNSEMPVFKNGVHVEMLLNPCGVPSRMNIGQNFEAFLGFVATLLDIRIQSNPFNGASYEEISLLMKYVWELANSPNCEAVFPKYPSIPKEIHDIARKRHSAIREWEGCFYPDGTAQLWNPKTGKYFATPVTFGVAYMLKLVHEVDHKMHSRAGMLEEEYSMIKKQPTEGAANGGGQRMGEMELVAMMAYGANAFLEETLNAASDNIKEKTNQVLESLGGEDGRYADKITPYRTVPESVNQLRYYLEVAGVKMEGTEGELPSVAYEKVKRGTTLDVRRLIAKQEATPVESTSAIDLRMQLRGLKKED